MDVCLCDFVVIAAILEGKCRIKSLTGSTIDGEVFQGNMMRHLFPNSENIFKINDLVTIY